jgi:O-succinylbenzoic acid--CoA ligase
MSEFERVTFDFCHDWLSDRKSFTLHTSGSTGTPKAIIVSRNQLASSAKLTIQVLGLQKNQTALVCLDTRYIAGIMMMVRCLEAGLNIVLVEPYSNPFEKIDANTKIDFTALVPLQVETILHSTQRTRLEKINSILVGGAALNNRTIHALQSFSCNFYATYGMTETLSHVALQKINGSDAQPYFSALPGITFTQDERGCLVITAPHLSNEPITTNDIVKLLSDSKFTWLGRADNIINTGGVKVIPEKIEATIQSFFDEWNITNRFFVFGIPDQRLGQSVSLIIEGSNLGAVLEERLIVKLNENHSRFEVPRSIYYVDSFIQTPTSKVNKTETVRLIFNS